MSDLIRAIHDSPYKIAIAVTGGGIGAIHDLFTTPGASRSMLEALVPYDGGALIRLLGGKPNQFCSSATARAIAMACYERARGLTSDSQQVLGVGCTASLTSDHPKQGEHRVHVAIQSGAATQTASVQLQKGQRDRQQEDCVASNLILELMHSVATNTAPNLKTNMVNEPVQHQRFDAPDGWKRLLEGECIWSSKDGVVFGQTLRDNSKSRFAIYSGAFDPRHEAHSQIYRIGEQRFDRVIFEVSMRNVDKPPLDFVEMASRAAQFNADEQLVFTRSPTFVEKARVFPGATFLVGIDTIQRISNPRYYGGDEKRNAAISELNALGCRFLVFGRTVDGAFQEFDPREVTTDLAAICDTVSEAEFRLDISSTAIRQSQQTNS